MVDFLSIATRATKKGCIEVYPKFVITDISDLMIRGGDFYAIWIESRGMWSTNELDAVRVIDSELDIYAEKHKDDFESNVRVLHLWDSETGMIDTWHKYCQKQMRDSFKKLDEKLTFANTETKKIDYASKKLSYPLAPGDFSSYDKLMSTLYSDSERRKIEWAIGSIVAGDSRKLQKFLVLYGSAGTGKSTVLNVIQQLFDGYYSVFDAKSLGSSNNSFALEAFRDNPLVAIQHDGDLSKLEDNTRLNSLVSHEKMLVNEKFKSAYPNRFNCFLFMGTNEPVKITAARSGLIRRLIDVKPSGNKLPKSEYDIVVGNIKFELGAIAWHCMSVYEDNKTLYDDYIPTEMISATNDFYNFMLDAYNVFERDDCTTLKEAWEMYKTYCEEAKVPYPYQMRIVGRELRAYFKRYDERIVFEDGTRARNYYSGFRVEKFDEVMQNVNDISSNVYTIDFNSTTSIFDSNLSDCPAQYASTAETPTKKWSDVSTKLSDIDTSRLHYVKVPENHIVIDFDIKDNLGNKSFEKNLEAASKWPKTYAELSKSGAGIHLHYLYSEDPTKLSRVYDDEIEIKVFTGNSSLRRKLTKCNDIPIATISSGLPLKGDKMVNKNVVKNEKGIRSLIKRNLNKEIHPGTKPSIDFIGKILDDAYANGVEYDVTDMRGAILSFAAGSTNHSEYCIKAVNKMKFRSESKDALYDDDNAPIIFYDVEVFPNLFLVNWKAMGEDRKVVRMINPTSLEIENLIKYKLVGFNCRRYDNHILYARLMGYTNEQLYELSRKIVSGETNRFFGEAYNISYTDIYDFASAGNKKSLKKLEIEMGIHHKELGFRWDEPVPEEKWEEVAEYCDNDVIATEAAFNYLKADWTARQILADLAGMSVNDTTNSLTQRIIFGTNREPQGKFNYRNLSEPVMKLDNSVVDFLKVACPEMMSTLHGEANSLLPYFPGYSYENGVSIYRGEEIGEGGYVYSEPGMYRNVALLDISSMHPHSAIAEVLFGYEYTNAFRELVEGRVSIKHEDWDEVNHILNGKLSPYIGKILSGEMTSKELANALKTAINSVYGLTSASFNNAFKDNRNIDNIVAKRGALFMVDLKHEVQKKGFTVAHIKTDSIKIPNATPEIIQFVMDFGKKYGYSFEHEATYDRMCLVNDAVYIAKYDNGKWTATGTEFQVPYVFKTLFSKEPIKFEDMCETKSVTGALYLDFNENTPDSHAYKFVGKVGLFCPIQPGCGGGLLMREDKGTYNAATGSKGYRWMEAEMVKNLGMENSIDRGYYNHLVDKAVDDISKYCDFEEFVSDESDTNSGSAVVCGDMKYATCFDCPNFCLSDGAARCMSGFDISKSIN